MQGSWLYEDQYASPATPVINWSGSTISFIQTTATTMTPTNRITAVCFHPQVFIPKGVGNGNFKIIPAQIQILASPAGARIQTSKATSTTYVSPSPRELAVTGSNLCTHSLARSRARHFSSVIPLHFSS